jgi:hypothetical protein
MFHWTPRTFWESTPHEIFAAFEAEERKAEAMEQSK